MPFTRAWASLKLSSSFEVTVNKTQLNTNNFTSELIPLYSSDFSFWGEKRTLSSEAAGRMSFAEGDSGRMSIWRPCAAPTCKLPQLSGRRCPRIRAPGRVYKAALLPPSWVYVGKAAAGVCRTISAERSPSLGAAADPSFGVRPSPRAGVTTEVGGPRGPGSRETVHF